MTPGNFFFGIKKINTKMASVNLVRLYILYYSEFIQTTKTHLFYAVLLSRVTKKDSLKCNEKVDDKTENIRKNCLHVSHNFNM